MLYSQVIRHVQQTDSENPTVTIPLFMFKKIMENAISTIEFDEAWYLDKYIDVKKALRNGKIRSAQEHFITTGYYEGRLPRALPVDKDFYLNTYPDIRNALDAGNVHSVADHFEKTGIKEGRSPQRNFTLFRR